MGKLILCNRCCPSAEQARWETLRWCRPASFWGITIACVFFSALAILWTFWKPWEFLCFILLGICDLLWTGHQQHHHVRPGEKVLGQAVGGFGCKSAFFVYPLIFVKTLLSKLLDVFICACESYRIYFSVSFTITASLLYVPINICSGVTHLTRSHSKQQLLHGKCKLPSYLFSLSGLLYLAPLFCLIFPEECTH